MDDQFWGCELTFRDGDPNNISQYTGGTSRLVSSPVSPGPGCYIRLRRMVLLGPRYKLESIVSVVAPVAMATGGGRGKPEAKEVALGIFPMYDQRKPRPRHMELDLKFDSDFVISLAPAPYAYSGVYDVQSFSSLRLHLCGSRGTIPSTVLPPASCNCCRSELEKLERRIRSLEADEK